MESPTFDDLTPPDELVSEWSTYNPFPEAAYEEAARWGALHGWEQARQLWPEPITDRPPTEADGDEDGWVCYLLPEGFWTYGSWETIAKRRDPWLHTPRWQPRQPSLQEQALDDLATIEARTHGADRLGKGHLMELTARIRRALLAAPKAAGVADDDLRGIFYQHSDSGDDGPPWMESEQFIVAARAVLARYGIARPAPVPVGERLPGGSELDDTGKCWLGEKGTSCDPTTWAYVYLAQVIDAASWPSGREWLPHWALPLPGDQ